MVMDRDALQSLFDASGQRKYLTADERQRFLRASRRMVFQLGCLCQVLSFTGCRISEALSLTPDNVLAERGTIVLPTLKQRQVIRYRTVPVPGYVTDDLRLLSIWTAHDARIWSWHRSTACQKIKEVMAIAKVVGPHACPRGLRHGFGVAAASAGVPVTLIQRWLGHSQIKSTLVYLQIMGPEERRFAERLWR